MYFIKILFHDFVIVWIKLAHNMIPGSKGHALHACMKKHDFGTRKT